MFVDIYMYAQHPHLRHVVKYIYTNLIVQLAYYTCQPLLYASEALQICTCADRD